MWYADYDWLRSDSPDQGIGKRAWHTHHRCFRQCIGEKSDGCYEVQSSEGEMGTKEEMTHYLKNLPCDDLHQLDALYEHSVSMRGEGLEDDFSIVCAMFP